MTLAERVGMSLNEFIETMTHHPFEFINGERKHTMPPIWRHSKLAMMLYNVLQAFVQQHALGDVMIETTFILPDSFNPNWVKGSRTPDVMFFAKGRLAAYEAMIAPDHADVPLSIVPDLVIEIISPNDSFSDIDEKVDAYLADGVQLIWLVDFKRRKVTVRTLSGDSPVILSGDAVLTGGDVLDGFEIRLSDLFA